MAQAIMDKIVGTKTNIQNMPLCEARLILALRVAVAAQKCGREPAPYVAERLGHPKLADSLSFVIAAVGDAWPENFQIGRPCCAQLTFDEAQFAIMFRMAALGNRPGFDSCLEEMLAEDSRNFIYARLRTFAAEYLGTST